MTGGNIEQCCSQYNGYSSAEEFVEQELSLTDAMMELGDRSFAFFDLGLSYQENRLLEELKIYHFTTEETSCGGTDIPRKIDSFMDRSVSGDDSVMVSLVGLIMRSIALITEAISHDNCRLSLLAYSDDLPFYFPFWHIDKTGVENGVEHPTPTAPEYVFITVFKGATTVFYELNDSERLEFLRISNESNHIYGYDDRMLYETGKGIDAMFSLSDADSPNMGQGSVHLAGRLHGAVHATPPGCGRMLMIITLS